MSRLDSATTAHCFNTPASYGNGASLVKTPVQAGYATTPVLTYTAYAQFSTDIQNGSISYPCKWVKTASQDKRDTVLQRLERFLLALGSVLPGPLGDDECVRVELEEPGHDLRFEVAPACEHALRERRRRQSSHGRIVSHWARTRHRFAT